MPVVSRSDHRDVVRHFQTGFEDGFESAGRGRVIEANDAVRARLELQQTLSRSISAARTLRQFATGDVVVSDRQLVAQEGFSVTTLARSRVGKLRSADVGDSLAAAVDQVFGCHSADGLIVSTNIGHLQAGEVPVYKNVGDLFLFEMVKLFGAPCVMNGADRQRWSEPQK